MFFTPLVTLLLSVFPLSITAIPTHLREPAIFHRAVSLTALLVVKDFSAFIPYKNASSASSFIWFHLTDPRNQYPLSAHCSLYQMRNERSNSSTYNSASNLRIFTPCRFDGGVKSTGTASFWFNDEDGSELVIQREWFVGEMYIRGEAPQQTYWSETEGGREMNHDIMNAGNKTKTGTGIFYKRYAGWDFPITSIVG